MKEISRLRLKFICYNMLIVTAVIGITFCAAALLWKNGSAPRAGRRLQRSCRRRSIL